MAISNQDTTEELPTGVPGRTAVPGCVAVPSLHAEALARATPVRRGTHRTLREVLGAPEPVS
jgi:hypothetical protein